jgi:hypothetical protein
VPESKRAGRGDAAAPKKAAAKRSTAPTKAGAASKAAVKKASAPRKAAAKKATAPKKATAKKATAPKKATAKKATAPKKATAKKATAPKKGTAPTKAAATKTPAEKRATGGKGAAKQAAAAKESAPTVAPRPVRQLPPPSKGPGMTDRRWPAGPEVRIPVERQKAAQAAGTFELSDLPSWLAEPSSAIRVGKGESTDAHLVPSGVRSLESITKLKPGQVIVNYGKSEAKWATDYSRRRGGRAAFLQLLSYARQMIGIDSAGRVRICLMGHAGQGFSEALWIEREGVVLTVQPNDIILRFEGLDLGE